MSAPRQFPTSRRARTMDLANTRAVSSGSAKRAMMRRSPVSAVNCPSKSPSSKPISGVWTQSPIWMACGARSTLAPVEYRVGTITGSVIGGCVIFLAINQSPMQRRIGARIPHLSSRQSFRRGSFSVAAAHSSSSEYAAPSSRLPASLAAFVRSKAAFFVLANARPTAFLTGRAA